ncbi:gliding motility-associated C-terminal domain-containing protein [Flavivirga sp. 57AJ16]|uniref:DUF7507 domain-containing protein n=1 Tax=Flavivirga sp. 57AJ16 TaxID=3025307 RepID=UPI0023658F15|nr:gliding motility-associated C-terminal domain-containing protein [Flavivirga sp. 57AJ16]MDD7888158.1 gliding motility-associated C-terminal domain-containing protein [Flavivirga sp. 57AJ16]
MRKITYLYLVVSKFCIRTKPKLFGITLLFVLLSFTSVFAVWSDNIYNRISNYFLPVTVPCNTDLPVPITNSDYTDLTATSTTTGICVIGCGIQDAANLVDSNHTNFASATTLLGVGVTHTLRVTDNTLDEYYSSGNYAGFLIENSSVVQNDLLDAIVVRTYLDGVEQESNSSTSLLAVNSTLLGSNSYYVGFYTTQNFDAVEISISSLASALSTTNIYYAVTNSFCVGPALECNTPTMLAKPNFPARIVNEHTGMEGVISTGSVVNAIEAIDSDSNTYASMNFNLGVGATGNLAIKDELTNHIANTYVGFDIENTSVLSLDLLNGITLRTYLDGVLQESKTGSSELLSVDSGLLFTGTERSQVGFVTALPFDEVQISIEQTSINLGSTRIYGLVLESFCEGPLECDTPTVLSNPSQSVIINNSRTGVEGIACVGCEVDNATNVISESNSDFALINVAVGVSETASVSVKDVLVDYPVGTFAGFVLRDTNNLLEINLLSSIIITTYLDDVQQEQQTAGNLLAIDPSGLVDIIPTSTTDFYAVGFDTTLAFDEVRITVESLAGVLNSIEVYGEFIDATNSDFCQVADIALIKTGVFNDEDADGCSDVGETLTYTFTVTNTGNSSITNVVLTDPMLGGAIALASGDTDSDSELDVTETWTYTSSYAITQADIDGGSVSNQATVTGTSTGGTDVSDLSDDDSALEDDVTETALCQSAGIALIKVGVFNDEDADGCSDVGETLTYTFTVSNTGNSSITNVVLTDPMLGGAIALASGDTDSDSELDVTETWTYTSSYAITQADIDGGSVSNQATVTGTSTGGTDVTDLSDDDSALEDDVTETALCQSAGIALIKVGAFNDEDADGCSDAGETLTYTFTVSNTGNSSITNVVLTDPMLGGAIALASGDTDSDSELDVTETWTYTSSYAITQADIDGGSVSNQATVTGTSTGGTDVTDLSDDDSALEDDVTETALCQSAGIALIKTALFNDEDADGCSDAGETLTYTFTVTNTGNSSITNVVLTDPMLGGAIALASGDTDSDSELDVTETWTYTSSYAITQADIDGGSVSNQATVTGTSTGGTDVTDLSDDDSALEDDVTETALCQSAGIALIKVGVFNDEDADGCSDAGETLTYTFTVSNTGNSSITNVVLTDPMLGGAIALASGDTDSDSELDVTETWTYTSSYAITQADIDGGSVSNQATVTGTSTGGTDVTDLSDDDSALEDDVTETALCQSAGIALIKVGAFNDEDADGCSDAGETLTYTFTVSNTGNSSITNVVLTDPMLGGAIALASGDTDSDSELDVTETWTYTSSYAITQADIDGGSVSNQATVTGTSTGGTDVSDLSDDDSALEDDVTETALCQSADIALIKVGVFNDENADGCSDAGETLTYTFTVSNTGNSSITNVVLTDPMLGGAIALASGDTDSDSELDVTETWTYTSSYAITQADIDGGSVSNQATVMGIGVNGVDVNDLSDDDSVLEDDVTETILCISNSISLEKEGVFNDENNSGAVQVGETITYTFTVYNTGENILYNITIQDALPGIVIQGGPIMELLPGETDSTTFTATYTVTAQDISDGMVTNQAIVIAEDILGNPVTDTSDDPNNPDNVDVNNDGEPDDPTITILPDSSNAPFEIFNAMSPDGDGLNDFFRIDGIENYPDNNLKIYNRWGVLIYETDAYGVNSKTFKGMSDGRVTVSKKEALPTGTYFYILTRFTTNQDPLINKGYLYIKRN